jgi:uncharacterized protein YchJ
MNPESANCSAADKYTDCPIPMTHRRLAAAHLLWHQALEHYHDSDPFLANLNSTIEALRNVTFVLQKEQAVPDFAAWYGKWQAALKENAAAKWLQGARTKVVHQGELESQSTAEVRLVTWQDHTLASVVVPAETPSALILQGLPLLSLVEKSGARPGDVEDAAIAVERRWSAEGLDGREILETLAEVYGLLSDMVLEAHTLLRCFACIPEESDHPDFPSSYHRTGTLECMVVGVEQRTQRFKLSTLDELIPVMASESAPGLLMEAADRYGINKDGKLAAWQMSDPATVAENVLYRAKRVLRKDKCHHRMMFIRDGLGNWHNATLFAADRTEKHLLMRLAADFVERKGCDALIEVGEVWIEPTKPVSGISNAAPPIMGRREALFVSARTREGFRRTSVTPFKRGPFGGIKIGDTYECDDTTMLYLQPIIEVWRKQGYIRLQDGHAIRRLWEPDPLDVCFCGGPLRFAECCKGSVDQEANHQKASAAMDASDFATAEKCARAAVAQYVIWVRRHTAFTINTARGLYQELADIDALALEGLLRGLGRAQKANGTDSGFVPQLRHLASTIGIPKISARLIALASEWFFREGRSEEGVLELDRLGGLRKVEDTLALMMAARFCDLDARAREEMLRRASSSALCKEESWAARLALAEHLFRRNAKEEALSLAEVVIAETGIPGGSIGALAEASLLRWRITKTESDFELAMNALNRDPDRGRHAGDLIDEGKYDEAEAFLADAINAGDLMAKLLTIDARLRTGKQDAARDLFLTINDPVPAHFQYPYGVAAALVALFLRDKDIRHRALAILAGLPAAAVESDKSIQSYLAALQDKAWDEQAD